MGNGFGARHSSGLRSIRIQFTAANDSNAMLLPIGFVVRLWIGHPLLLFFAAAISKVKYSAALQAVRNSEVQCAHFVALSGTADRQ